MADANESVLPGRPSLLGKPGYAYSTLSEVEKRAYARLVNTIEARERIRLADYPELEAKDISRLLACIDMDHPEFFWMDGYQSRWAITKANYKLLMESELGDEVVESFWKGVDYDGDGRISLLERRIAGGRAALQANPLLSWAIDGELKLSPLWFGWRIDKIKAQLDAYVEECARYIPDGADDYAIFRRTFEFVARHTTYDLENAQKAQDVRSAMIDHRSVCKGYAETFQYLLLSFGIPCLSVQGIAGSSESTPGPHAWNYVLVDGAWNRVDVTWGDWDLDTWPERVSQVPERIRGLFVDYSRMCVPGECYRPSPVIAYPETGNTGDYFIREGYELGTGHLLDYARMCLRLFKGEEPYTLVRYPNGKEADHEFVIRQFWKARDLCLAADLDEATLRGALFALDELLDRMVRVNYKESPMADFVLAITMLPGKDDIVLVTATGCQGEGDEE